MERKTGVYICAHHPTGVSSIRLMYDFNYMNFCESQLFRIFFDPNQMGVQLALCLDKAEAVEYAQETWPSMPVYRIDCFYRVQAYEKHLHPILVFNQTKDRVFTRGSNIIDLVKHKRQRENGIK